MLSAYGEGLTVVNITPVKKVIYVQTTFECFQLLAKQRNSCTYNL